MAPERPCIIVAGLGRCGSSLTMQMLHAAGVECAGEWPGFEDDRTSPLSPDVAWLAGQRGKAVKVLDAHRIQFTNGLPNHVVIWLSRDAREQAKSQLKFLRAMMPGIPTGRTAVRAMAASFENDRREARARLGLHGGCPFLSLQFESLIEQPHATTALISNWLAGFGYKIKPDRMASVVRDRPTKCLPGLLEIDMLAGAEHPGRRGR